MVEDKSFLIIYAIPILRLRAIESASLMSVCHHNREGRTIELRLVPF